VLIVKLGKNWLSPKGKDDCLIGIIYWGHQEYASILISEAFNNHTDDDHDRW